MVVSCHTDEKLQMAKGEGVEKELGMPEAPQGNKAGFTLATEENSLRSVIGTGAHVFSERDRIYLRSVYYEPTVDQQGNVSINVTEASSGNYQMFCFPKGSKYWYRDGGDNPLDGLVIPYSQFYRSTADSLAYFPMYASFKGNPSEGIVFKEVISAVGITLSGSAKIASVHLQNKAATQLLSDNLAGVASFDPEKGFVLTEGVDFINLNCTDEGRGVSISEDGTTFYLVLAPGNYSSGLTLTVTGMDHKGQTFDVPAFEVEAGQVKTFSFVYAPDPDLLWFEHFDNFVWGGNVKGGKNVSSYAPDDLSSPDKSRSGYEEAFTTVGITTPGSALIQDKWDTINGWTVGERPNVGSKYLKSRNISDYTYLYRCQEYQGCMSVGAGDQVRGGIQPIKAFSFDETFFGVRLSFDICLRYGTEDKFCSQLGGSGIASSLFVDGKEIELENTLEGNNTYVHSFQNICSIRRSDIPGPTSERYSEGWHHVEMTFTNMNDLSTLGIWGYDTGSNVKHGCFIDNIEMRYEPVTHPQNRLRVLLYNIYNGMWADQDKNFDNFVAFIRKYDPDVCIFCEAQSMWKDGLAENDGIANYRLFTGREGRNSTATHLENTQWKALAARFGHAYTAVGGYHDDYPQVITSKYPVTTISRLTSGKDNKGSSTNISHGAGHFQVTVDGKNINFVSLHLWPFKYSPSYWDASTEQKAEKQAESAEKYEGYSFAAREVEAILNATAKRKDCGDDWLVMGDTNSISPLDGDYYESKEYSDWTKAGEMWVLPHLAFRSGDCGRNLFDMLREGEGSYYTGPGRFMPSTSGQSRIDIMYGSESMRRRVSGMSLIIRDKWCNITESAVFEPATDPNEKKKHPKLPSDHRPLLIEFDMDK